MQIITIAAAQQTCAQESSRNRLKCRQVLIVQDTREPSLADQLRALPAPVLCRFDGHTNSRRAHANSCSEHVYAKPFDQSNKRIQCMKAESSTPQSCRALYNTKLRYTLATTKHKVSCQMSMDPQLTCQDS